MPELQLLALWTSSRAIGAHVDVFVSPLLVGPLINVDVNVWCCRCFVFAVHFASCMATANATVKSLQQTYNPIPGWREVANSYDGVTGEFKIPFVGFSFAGSNSWTSGNGTKYDVPDQLVIDTGFVPGATPQPPQVRIALIALGLLCLPLLPTCVEVCFWP